MVRCVTFDCAGTLVKLHCSVEQAVVAVANADPMEGQLFQAMFMGRLSAFHQVNLTRDPQQGRVFWVQLLADWLVRIGRDPKTAEDLQNRVDTSIFSEPS